MNLPGAKMKMVLLTIVGITAIGAALLVYHSVSLSDKIDRVRLENENILSENIQLNKMVDGLKRDTSLAHGRNRELSRMLENARAQIEAMKNK